MYRRLFAGVFRRIRFRLTAAIHLFRCCPAYETKRASGPPWSPSSLWGRPPVAIVGGEPCAGSGRLPPSRNPTTPTRQLVSFRPHLVSFTPSPLEVGPQGRTLKGLGRSVS